MKTLWVHIGMAKTASSSIQLFCGDNAEVLEKKGFHYPIFPFAYRGIAKVHNGRFLLGMIKDENGHRNKKQEEKNFEEGMKIVHELFQSHDNIILSDESIWRGMDMEKKDLWEIMMKEAAKGGFCIRVIVYLRRQDKFFPSNWNQLVKKQWSVEAFEDYSARVDKLFLNYYEKLERMASFIGKENIIVRRFEPGRFEGGSIYADFLSVFGLPFTDEYKVSEEFRNTGLYGNTHEIKRILNSLPQIKDRRVQNFILDQLKEVSKISSESYPSEMFSKEEILELLNTYGPGNRKVAEEYLKESGTDLFDNSVKDVPKWQKDNPYMADDIIRFVGVVSTYLYQENQKLEKEVHELLSFQFHVKHPIKTIIRKIGQKIRKEE